MTIDQLADLIHAIKSWVILLTVIQAGILITAIGCFIVMNQTKMYKRKEVGISQDIFEFIKMHGQLAREDKEATQEARSQIVSAVNKVADISTPVINAEKVEVHTDGEKLQMKIDPPPTRGT